MLPYRDSRITQIALVSFFVLVVGYGYFEARGLLFGPSITVTSQTAEVSTPLVEIQGHADRISSLSMNGNAISVTESGDFSEPYVLAPGYNRITLDAQDKYGRTSSQTIEVIYTGVLASSSPATTTPDVFATSTPSSSTSSAALAPGQ